MNLVRMILSWALFLLACGYSTLLGAECLKQQLIILHGPAFESRECSGRIETSYRWDRTDFTAELLGEKVDGVQDFRVVAVQYTMSRPKAGTLQVEIRRGRGRVFAFESYRFFTPTEERTISNTALTHGDGGGASLSYAFRDLGMVVPAFEVSFDNYTLAHDERNVFETVHARNISLLAHLPLGEGFFGMSYSPFYRENLESGRSGVGAYFGTEIVPSLVLISNLSIWRPTSWQKLAEVDQKAEVKVGVEYSLETLKFGVAMARETDGNADGVLRIDLAREDSLELAGRYRIRDFAIGLSAKFGILGSDTEGGQLSKLEGANQTGSLVVSYQL